MHTLHGLHEHHLLVNLSSYIKEMDIPQMVNVVLFVKYSFILVRGLIGRWYIEVFNKHGMTSDYLFYLFVC
jgi:hypothetical protein